jgi:hypothetical protein
VVVAPSKKGKWVEIPADMSALGNGEQLLEWKSPVTGSTVGFEYRGNNI